jgi:hypothetical protein
VVDALGLLLGEVVELEQLAEPEDGVERGAQLVALAGEKLALCPVGPVGALFGLLDCQDVSPAATGTAGTANTWLDNVGATDKPDGICSPLVDDPTTTARATARSTEKKQTKHRPDPCACTRHPRAY